MNLTVAMRVISGFAIISLLLIFLSIWSITSLSSVGSATDEVSELALPTVSGSSNLKASFLNMGRLTFEAYLARSKSALQEKRAEFEKSKLMFDEQLGRLKVVVGKDRTLNSKLLSVDEVYNDYTKNAFAVYDNHASDLDLRNQIADQVAVVEESADDASSLLLDFADLDIVANSATLRRASDLGESLETTLLTLLSSTTDFTATDDQQRAEIRRKEVEVMISQTREKYAEIISIANGLDDSGTLEEVDEYIQAAIDEIQGTNGILNKKMRKLEIAAKAKQALANSDNNIAAGQDALNTLLELANQRADEIKESVQDEVSSSTYSVIVVVFISLGIAAAIAYKSVTAITMPLQKVNQLLRIASKGDLTHRLDDSSEDEFGELARNCNLLIDNLKRLIMGINDRAAQLAAASGETSTVTAQTTHSIEEQKSQISHVAAATTEMHSTSELVSQGADDTLTEIKHADSEAEKVKRISADNKATILVLAKDVQDAADVINKLHQDSASISGILDVIRGVADQTNLLALNAAIEAARAGEQGRGFAVVADEVRTLASRTQQSTQEINAMIEVLQAGAERAVEVMRQGKDQTEVCVAQTEKASQALNLITDAVHRAHEVSSRIEQAAREQHTVSSEISEKLESIVGIAEETTLGAQQTTASSAEVARLADELRESIGEFKV